MPTMYAEPNCISFSRLGSSGIMEPGDLLST